jgi:hypothetical protein
VVAVQDTDSDNRQQRAGLSRRDAIKKGAIATGLVWAAPAVTTYGSRAMAQASPPPPVNVCVAQFNIRWTPQSGLMCSASRTGFQGNFGNCPSPINTTQGVPPCSNVNVTLCVPGSKNNTATEVTVEAPANCTITQGTAHQDNGGCVTGVPGPPNRMNFVGVDILTVRVRVECPA